MSGLCGKGLTLDLSLSKAFADNKVHMVHLRGFVLGRVENILGIGLIKWCVKLFSTVFQLYHRGQCTYPCFPGFL